MYDNYGGYPLYHFGFFESKIKSLTSALSCLKVYILATLTRLFLPLGNSSLWETPNLTLSLDGALADWWLNWIITDKYKI